jgi:NAD(P)-dependent dehydrogenase (short-subunit alcohol dehydrogenase family)
MTTTITTMKTMEGRTCLVTGATDGHGKAVAEELAVRGADLVLLARNREKALAVQDEIAKQCGGKAPEIILADLASADDVDCAIDAYRASGKPLHVLVNNAGLVGLSRRVNDAGLEMTFAVNYLAMFRLTLGLLPLLEESRPARIVNISSDTYRVARLHFDDLQLEHGYGLMKAYGQSKLAILYFTLELARRIEGGGVTVNAVDPGPVASNIGADNPGMAYRLVAPLLRRFFPGPARAARTALMVATDPALAAASGGYYRSQKRRPKPLDFDPAVSHRLWQTSLELSGMERDPLDAFLAARGPEASGASKG